MVDGTLACLCLAVENYATVNMEVIEASLAMLPPFPFNHVSLLADVVDLFLVCERTPQTPLLSIMAALLLYPPNV